MVNHFYLDRAKHYWIYHRLINGKNVEVMGDPVLPYFVDEKTDLSNRALLNTLLNEKSVFDKPINPKEGDLLQLSFLVKGDFGRITYGFKFHDGKWIEEEYDTFEWMAHYHERKRGKIINAIKDKND